MSAMPITEQKGKRSKGWGNGEAVSPGTAAAYVEINTEGRFSLVVSF
jgi:hypothetical protein